jgi:hypothetical protein
MVYPPHSRWKDRELAQVETESGANQPWEAPSGLGCEDHAYDSAAQLTVL